LWVRGRGRLRTRFLDPCVGKRAHVIRNFVFQENLRRGDARLEYLRAKAQIEAILGRRL
jgi:hypothetical protein